MADKDTVKNSPKPLLTDTEEKFFVILKSIIKDRYDIDKKIKLSDIVTLKERLPKKDFDTFTRQHIDFTLCDKNIPSIVKLLIEYDDPSHEEKKSIRYDEIKNKTTTSIPFVRISIYDNLQTIKNKIEGKLNSSNQTKENVTTKNEVYIDNSQIYDTEQPERYNNNSIWSKPKEALKEFLIEKGIPAIIGIVIIIFIGHRVTSNLFNNTLKNIQQKNLPKNPINIPPPLIPAQPPPSVISSPKIKVKVRIAGKYISENKSYVMYERTDTRKQKNVTIEDFLKMCECSATELYTDKLMEIVE